MDRNELRILETFCTHSLSEMFKERKANIIVENAFNTDIPQSLAAKWLREVHSIHYVIDVVNDEHPYWTVGSIFDFKTQVILKQASSKRYNSFEDATEAALLSCLMEIN